MDFWTLQEASQATADKWDYLVGPRALRHTAHAFIGPHCHRQYARGVSGTYTIPAVTGATSYTWTVSGTGWSGSSTTNSISITAGTGTGTVTVAANGNCGTSALYTFNPASTPVSGTRNNNRPYIAVPHHCGYVYCWNNCKRYFLCMDRSRYRLEWHKYY